jgi:leucyl-tRNA synthetase
MKILHQTIQKVTEDVESLGFNTAISQLMVMTNELTKSESRPKAVLEPFLLLLSPFAPHLAEECWSRLGHSRSLAYEPWPEWDEQYLTEDEIEIIIQLKGKLKGRMTIPASLPREDYQSQVESHPDFEKWTAGLPVRKWIVVPEKLVNLVT